MSSPLVFSLALSAKPEELWKSWTTDQGVRRFFAPDSRVSAVPGGPYELYFDLQAPEGFRGSEGMTVLAAEPPWFLSFTWNAPPSIPAIRGQRTWVELRIEEDGGEPVLTLVHGGWGSGGDWKKAREYFQRAWGDIVLPRLKRSLLEGPITWDQESR